MDLEAKLDELYDMWGIDYVLHKNYHGQKTKKSSKRGPKPQVESTKVYKCSFAGKKQIRKTKQPLGMDVYLAMSTWLINMADLFDVFVRACVC